MQHDHDDGLVHSHAWARDRGPMIHRIPPPKPRPAREEVGHDDGLVHNHGWARSGQ